VTDEGQVLEPAETEQSSLPRASNKAVVVALVAVALVAGAFAARLIVPDRRADEAKPTSPASLTTRHNDALVDYSAATDTGRPIYVLFHSLT